MLPYFVISLELFRDYDRAIFKRNCLYTNDGGLPVLYGKELFILVKFVCWSYLLEFTCHIMIIDEGFLNHILVSIQHFLYLF